MHFETIIILIATKFSTRMIVYFLITDRSVENCEFRGYEVQLEPIRRSIIGFKALNHRHQNRYEILHKNDGLTFVLVQS